MPILKRYWCRLIDERGVTISAEVVEAIEDAAVIKIAMELFGNRPAKLYEIFDGARLVHSEEIKPTRMK